MFPRAKARMAVSATNKDAWKSVLQHMSSSKLSTMHPTSELRKALISYAAFGISTSGVEQHFSKSIHKFTVRQLSALQDREELCIKVSLDISGKKLETILENAQLVWRRCMGATRTVTPIPRIDKGVKRAHAGNVLPSERDFVAKRRRAALAAGSKVSPSESQLPDPVVPGASWGPTHVKELDFLQQKQHVKAVHAYAENAMLPCELERMPGLAATAAAQSAKRLADHQARMRRAARVTANLKGTSGSSVLQALRGKKVFVQHECRSRSLGIALMERGLIITVIAEAEAFVVQTPGHAPLLVCAASALRGSFQVSPQLVLSGGARGVAVKMIPKFHLPKTVFISPACAASEPEFCAHLQRLVGKIRGCKWNIKFVNWPALKATERAGNLFALLDPGELGSPGWAGHKHKFTVADFSKRLACVDATNTVHSLR